MSTPTLLSEPEYEALAMHSLLLLGMTVDQAAAIVRDRWPMSSGDVIAEVRGRGLVLSMDDVRDCLRWWDAGLDVEAIGWTPENVDVLLKWARVEGRGRPVESEADRTRLVAPVLVEEMFAGLRSPDVSVRIVAGATLAFSLGAGCKLAGEHVEDFEMIVSPQLSDLLARAMAGEAAAVDELEGITTTDPEVLRRLKSRSRT